MTHGAVRDGQQRVMREMPLVRDNTRQGRVDTRISEDRTNNKQLEPLAPRESPFRDIPSTPFTVHGDIKRRRPAF